MCNSTIIGMTNLTIGYFQKVIEYIRKRGEVMDTIDKMNKMNEI